MYSDFDKRAKVELIVLSHLQNVERSSSGHISSWAKYREKEKSQKNKTREEIEKEVEKEINDEKEKLSKESLEKYYKIEKGKDKELEKIFKTFKSKVKSPKINYLDKGKFWSFSNNLFTVLDSVSFKKLYEINLILKKVLNLL